MFLRFYVPQGVVYPAQQALGDEALKRLLFAACQQVKFTKDKKLATVKSNELISHLENLLANQARNQTLQTDLDKVINFLQMVMSIKEPIVMDQAELLLGRSEYRHITPNLILEKAKASHNIELANWMLKISEDTIYSYSNYHKRLDNFAKKFACFDKIFPTKLTALTNLWKAQHLPEGKPIALTESEKQEIKQLKEKYRTIKSFDEDNQLGAYNDEYMKIFFSVNPRKPPLSPLTSLHKKEAAIVRMINHLRNQLINKQQIARVDHFKKGNPPDSIPKDHKTTDAKQQIESKDKLRKCNQLCGLPLDNLTKDALTVEQLRALNYTKEMIAHEKTLISALTAAKTTANNTQTKAYR